MPVPRGNELRAIEVPRANEIGAGKVGTIEGGLEEIGAGKIGLDQYGAVESRATQVRLAKICSGKVHLRVRPETS